MYTYSAYIMTNDYVNSVKKQFSNNKIPDERTFDQLTDEQL
jgi:hypothetical protein